MFNSIENIKNILIKLTSFACVIFVASIVLLVALGVVLRYIFNYSLYWIPELTSYLFLWYIYLGAILVTEKQSHLKMDYIKDKLPNNVKMSIEFIFNLLIIWFLIMLLNGSIKLIQVNYLLKSPVLRIPEVIALSCAQISALSILIIYIFRFLQIFITIYNKIKLSRK